METKRITFLGQDLAVPFIGAFHLRSIAAALRELMQQTGVDTDAGLLALQARDYPALVLMALDHILEHLGSDLGLTRSEELFFGSLGLLFATWSETHNKLVGGYSAYQVATAPLDELVALCSTVFMQEAETTAGKRLMAMLSQFGQPPTKNTQKPSTGASTSDTTSQKTTRQRSTIGGRKPGG